MKRALLVGTSLVCLAVTMMSAQGQAIEPAGALSGKRLFETETFGGNGRTCRTCHDAVTGTLSVEDVRRRFKANPNDPLFLHDGSNDFNGHGVSRIRANATVLINVPLAPNITLADDPSARFVTLRRGVASTLNTPALDPVLMLDGRQPNLEAQAAGAIQDHAQGVEPSLAALRAIARFQRTAAFFSSPDLREFARGGPAPGLPEGRTNSEKRGRRFFEDVPPDLPRGGMQGLCALCHSGPLLNTTNEFASLIIQSPAPIPAGQRFLNVGVSEFNRARNPVREFVFNKDTPQETHVFSPDPGRALTTGVVDDPTLEHVNAFRIASLRGIRHTAPYFHDNSAKSLKEVMSHYVRFFFLNSFAFLSRRDEKDIEAYMRLLD